jgi:phage-Barnase-EndoU-ColicinE5/D-RelE like nuclease2
MSGCAHAGAITVAIDVRYNERTVPANHIDRKKVCLDCLGFIDTRAILIHDFDQRRLAANRDLNQPGFKKTPTLKELLDNNSLPVIPTVPDRRIDADPQKLDDRYLEGLMRARLRFTAARKWRRNYPRIYTCPYIDHPIIVHAGLFDKILEEARDPGHVRFLGYIPDVLANPSEVYIDEEEDEDGDMRPIYRIISTLSVTDEKTNQVYHYFVHAVVHRVTHVLSTSYNVMPPPRIEGYRRDTPIYLAWALTPV